MTGGSPGAAPAKVYVEPTNACNLACATCVRHAWDEPEGFMEWGTFEAVVEGEGHLRPHDEALGQHRPQRIVGGTDRGGVRTVLWLGDDELPADELDRIPFEHSQVDESLVFDARPASKSQRSVLHTRHAIGHGGRGQCPRPVSRAKPVPTDAAPAPAEALPDRAQPLTEPAVRPCTMYFWKISTSRTAGSAPRNPVAAITE